MDKEVLIHVRGLQTMDADGEQEPLEIVVPGQYYFRNGSHYLRYEEVMEDFAEPTVNYIKISRKGMEVRKKGVVNVHMVFEQGKKNMTYYTTPYGTIEMGIAATNLNLQESDGGLDMKVDYALDMNQEHVAEMEISLQEGLNRITVYAGEAGIVLERLVVLEGDAEMEDSYLGTEK